MNDVKSDTDNIKNKFQGDKASERWINDLFTPEKKLLFENELAFLVEEYNLTQEVPPLQLATILTAIRTVKKNGDKVRDALRDRKIAHVIKHAYKKNGGSRKMRRDFEAYRRLPLMLGRLLSFFDPHSKKQRSPYAGRKMELSLYRLILGVVQIYEKHSGLNITEVEKKSFCHFLKMVVFKAINYPVDNPLHLFETATQYRSQLQPLQSLFEQN